MVGGKWQEGRQPGPNGLACHTPSATSPAYAPSAPVPANISPPPGVCPPTPSHLSHPITAYPMGYRAHCGQVAVAALASAQGK